jgi:hypothetical protein
VTKINYERPNYEQSLLNVYYSLSIREIFWLSVFHCKIGKKKGGEGMRVKKT